ncbi:hypothetical protein [Micavibrio aeruginosavorus]|uniref:hypothetical protein n=1 Tax=Micavibrio aeruginosavorus TaxID=349221 RepID=UPI0011D20540|nr:hypothetical protein [Micavibrio aeruginosavorus]
MKQWKKLCATFAKAAHKAGIAKIHLGAGGNTPNNMGFAAAHPPAKPADYNKYRDSEEQYVITG